MEYRPSWEGLLSIFYSRISPPCMEPEGPLPCSQEPATCSYPEPDTFSPHPLKLFI